VGGTSIGRNATPMARGLSNQRAERYYAAMTSNSVRLATLLAAIAAAAALRLVPHPPNLSPIDGMALFSGAYLGRRWLAFAAPIGALLLSDFVLGFYSGMLFQYAAVAIVVLFGMLALSRPTVVRLAVATVASSALFFGLSNFGVWVASGMYADSVAGVAACYAAAIPFFQNTVAGDLFYSGLLFGGFALAERLVPQLKAKGAQPA
jgi:hypothetical protein